MNYSQIISLIFNIITFVIGGLGAYYIIFALIGLILTKKYPKTDIKKRYAILVSARNEETVIGNLIESINKNEYPTELIKIFVVAHNCTDRTAEVARLNGAEVFEYNNASEKTKGYALKYLVNQIKDKYGINSFDAYMVLDADNILTPNYISKMNDAFVYYNGERAITSFRASKNYSTNVITGLYGLFFIANCVLDNRGRTVLNCSTRVQGTGFMLPASTLVDGWNYVTLTEDWELSADQVLQKHKIMYCDEAIFYDEQPSSVKVMLRQRLRWQKGHLMVFRTKFFQLFKNLFRKNSYKVSSYDIAYEILPLGAISFSLIILQTVLLLFCPLFKQDFASVMVPYLISLLVSFVSFYLTLFVLGILVAIREHKRIRAKNAFHNMLICILFPLFFMLTIVLDFVCIFVTDLQWKTIPHLDTSTFEMLNNKSSKIKVIKTKQDNQTEEEKQII